MRWNEIISEAAGSEPQWSNAQYSNFGELKQAIKSVWGSDEFERKMVKSKGSYMGFTLGVSHLINKKGQVVGYWELTGASMEPGRGTVTRGYGQVAVKKAPAKPKAEKVAKVPAAKKPATPEELNQAAAALKSAFKAGSTSYADYQELEGGIGFSVRYWGSWQVPADAEDDGDYDWEELTPESAKKLQQIINSVEAKYPNVRFEVSDSEKNWLTAELSSKL
jgi:hypothetical protein